jgi:DNA-binding GntR family transcriptional regulator
MPRSSPRADLAYQALRQAIIEQALLPGARLPEDQIGAMFGMSRTLVRSTLGRLLNEGLVDAQPKRTMTVARPSLEEAREIFEARRALEREAVALTIRRWRPEFGAELEGLVREEEAARARSDDRASIRLAGEFHIRLAAMSGNRVLVRYLGELVSRCSLILAAHGRPHSSECAINEHRELIAALRAGDSATATGLMDDHVGSVEQRALLSSEAGGEPDLNAVLSRYASAIEAHEAATPLAAPLKKKARR